MGGAGAGAIATWPRGKATTYLLAKEPRSVRTAENKARGNRTAYGVAAQKVAMASGRKLSVKDRERYGKNIHWALGIGAGAAYGVVRERLPGGLARGLLFGATFWLLTDEGIVYLLGLTPGPTHFPWQTHARGLAGHLMFGAVADATMGVQSAVRSLA